MIELKRRMPITPTEKGVEPVNNAGMELLHQNPQSLQKRQNEPFTSMSGKRNYNAMYRAAHDLHERHKDPMVIAEFWHTHRRSDAEAPAEENRYWLDVGDDVISTTKTFHDDPFAVGLLSAVLDELQREYFGIIDALSAETEKDRFDLHQ